MKLLIKNGKLIDPSSNIEEVMDIFVERGKIAKISKNLKVDGAKVIDARNKWVVPGLIDLHVHLREPGFEEKETIYTGTLAAAKGGFTTIVAMPNTNPVIDSAGLVNFVLERAKSQGIVNVLLCASITRGGKGEEITDFHALKEAGIVGLSDDPDTIMNAEVLRRAMEYAKSFSIPIFTHCEDKNLTHDGVMNEGITSTLLGLRGMPSVAESIIVARNILLAEYTGCRIHISHVSTKNAVEMMRWMKRIGINSFTCETCPHYFTLTEEAVKYYNTNAKVNPPLRTIKDVEEIKKGLKDGTIDCIATDHAPHTQLEKDNIEFNQAPFGISGLETAISIVITELIDKKVLSVKQAIEKLTINPAKILGIDRGSLKVGKVADITIIDPNKEFIVDTSKFVSKGKNSPFHGVKLKGIVTTTIVAGKIVWQI
jgi:dihydroorotase